MKRHWFSVRSKPSEKEFAEHLVRGVMTHLEEIDTKLASSRTHNWTLQRMAMVDRNLLRLGVFEIVFEEQTAHRVSINEAVELAKGLENTLPSKVKRTVLTLSL